MPRAEAVFFYEIMQFLKKISWFWSGFSGPPQPVCYLF